MSRVDFEEWLEEQDWDDCRKWQFTTLFVKKGKVEKEEIKNFYKYFSLHYGCPSENEPRF